MTPEQNVPDGIERIKVDAEARRLNHDFRRALVETPEFQRAAAEVVLQYDELGDPPRITFTRGEGRDTEQWTVTRYHYNILGVGVSGTDGVKQSVEVNSSGVGPMFHYQREPGAPSSPFGERNSWAARAGARSVLARLQAPPKRMGM